MGQVDPVLDLDGEAQLGHDVFFVLVHADVADVGVGFADFGGDPGQDAFFIVDQQADAAVEAAVQFGAPLHGDPAVRLFHAQPLGRGAVGRVYHQALISAQLADDLVPRNGQAAGGQLH